MAKGLGKQSRQNIRTYGQERQASVDGRFSAPAISPRISLHFAPILPLTSPPDRGYFLLDSMARFNRLGRCRNGGCPDFCPKRWEANPRLRAQVVGTSGSGISSRAGNKVAGTASIISTPHNHRGIQADPRISWPSGGYSERRVNR